MDKESFFMPLQFDKNNWDFSKKMFFLNSALENELTDEEHQRIELDSLENYNTIECEYIHDKVGPFVDKLLFVMADSLNLYHNVEYSREYWYRLLFVWVMEYCVAGYYTVELFENVRKQVGNRNITTSIYKSSVKPPRCFVNDIFDYVHIDDWMISIGKKIINLTVTYYGSDKETKLNLKKDEILKRKYDVCGAINSITLNKIKSKLYKKFLKKRAVVLLASSSFDSEELQHLTISTKGKIQPIEFFYTNQCNVIDNAFRQKMKKKLKKLVVGDVLWKEIITDSIFDDFPAMFVELYFSYYEKSVFFLKQYPNVKAIKVTTDLLGINHIMFLCHLARELKGTKLIGEQHGGNYGIQKNLTLYDENVSDIFYGWGAWAQHRKGITKFKRGVSIKLHKHSKKKETGNYILYIGTDIPTKINFHTNQTQINDGKRYIKWQIEFLSHLSFEDRINLILRNYYVDYGWHINNIIMERFPEVKLSGIGDHRDLCDVDYSVRDADFGTLLYGCEMLVCDHLSTTWLEALKVGKPIMLFFPENKYVYCESEKEYIKLMEEVEIIVHSPVRAAAILREMKHDGAWWRDNRRQQVVKIIKERYMGEECDAVKWWSEELFSVITES